MQKSNGAIRFTKNTESTNLLVEFSIFDSCSSIFHGGSLYFKDGECIQERVCYINSTSDYYAHAIWTRSSPSRQNFLKLSSVFSCGTIEKDTILRLNNGFIQMENLNMSNNIESSSGYSLYTEDLWNFIQFSDVINNTAKLQANFYHQNCNNFKIMNCNYLENHAQTAQINVLLFFSQQTTIENSCFKGNKCIYIFQTNGNVIVTVMNCFYDMSAVSGSVQFSSSKSDKNTISITHLDLEECFNFINIHAAKKLSSSCNGNQKHHSLINYLSKTVYTSVHTE